MERTTGARNPPSYKARVSFRKLGGTAKERSALRRVRRQDGRRKRRSGSDEK